MDDNEFIEKVKELLPELNVEMGMEYCGSDEMIYAMVINTYVEDRLDVKLQEAYETENWKNYTTYAHAVKSSSLTLGLEELSEYAKSFEFAGKEGNIDYIKENHDELIKRYGRVLEAITSLQ